MTTGVAVATAGQGTTHFNRLARRRSAAGCARRTVLVLAIALLAAACTSTTGGEAEPVPEEPTTTSSLAIEPTATTQPPPQLVVDIGVDLESGVIIAAVVTPSAAALAGHRAYWASVNLDLGGVGGELDVELFERASADAAFTSNVAVISLDQGPTEPVGPILAIAPSQTIDSVAAGRTLDVTRPTLGAVVSAASRLAADPDFLAEGTLGVVAGASCPFDPMTYQLTEGTGADFVLVCGTPEEARAALSDIGGVVFLTYEAWSPDLASDLPEDTYILGAVPEPGADAPAAEILATVADQEPWDPEFVRGYTAALTTHLALERAYSEGDLTRSGIMAAARDMVDADPGFGPKGSVTVAVPDDESPSGLRTVDRLDVAG